MTDYVIAIALLGAFCAGLATGIFSMYFGYRLGFKASYELRGDSDKGLFADKGEPAEFQLDENARSQE